MSDTPPPPPPTSEVVAAPTVRFRVVPGSDNVKRTKSPQITQTFQSQPPPQRIRYVRPVERLVYARAPPSYQVQRNEMPFFRQIQSTQMHRTIPTIIRQPITRIIRPINPQQNGNTENKKKLVTILRSFLTRCSTTPEANMSQMIIATEQYLKSVISTSEYMQILHQNVHGVRDTLANFLELNIYAVRKDIQEKKIAMGEVVQFQLVKTEAYNFQTPSSSSSSQQLNYSTSSPSLDASTVSTSQQNYVKSEPISAGSSQEQGASPNLIMPINTITTSVTYQMVKMEPGSSRSSPILRTSSPHFQLLNKSHGSVGANEQHQHRASPLTLTRDTSIQMPMQQPKTSPLAATTAPNIEMQTLSFFDQHSQEPMETSQVPSPQETTFITPPESQPQHVQQQHPQSQVSPPLSQEAAIDDDTPLTELPHEIALQRSLIDPETFSALMQRKVPGITIESPAFLMISEFLETKIRKLIGDARLAAEHRSQQFRSNPNYIEAENPRAQLNAIERAEKAEKQRKIDRENERLLKNSKNDSNKFKELAKTIDEEILNRDANEAAMSALAGKKRTWQSRKADGISDSGGPAAKKAALARAKQISMKDLLFAFEKDSFAKDSIVYRKVLYGLYNENKN